MGPLIIGSIVAYAGWEGYKHFFKRTPSQFPTKPSRMYFLQGVGAGPVNADIITSDLLGVNLTLTHGIIVDAKNPKLWSAFVTTDGKTLSPLPAVISSRFTITKLEEQGSA